MENITMENNNTLHTPITDEVKYLLEVHLDATMEELKSGTIQTSMEENDKALSKLLGNDLRPSLVTAIQRLAELGIISEETMLKLTANSKAKVNNTRTHISDKAMEALEGTKLSWKTRQ